MYPRIPWQQIADPLRSVGSTFGITHTDNNTFASCVTNALHHSKLYIYRSYIPVQKKNVRFVPYECLIHCRTAVVQQFPILIKIDTLAPNQAGGTQFPCKQQTLIWRPQKQLRSG